MALDKGAGPGDFTAMTARRETESIDCEVLIVGGGMVGLTLGLTLAGAGCEVAVIDREDPETALAAPFDGRASAIARGSKQALDGAGLWRGMADAAHPRLAPKGLGEPSLTARPELPH